MRPVKIVSSGAIGPHVCLCMYIFFNPTLPVPLSSRQGCSLWPSTEAGRHTRAVPSSRTEDDLWPRRAQNGGQTPGSSYRPIVNSKIASAKYTKKFHLNLSLFPSSPGPCERFVKKHVKLWHASESLSELNSDSSFFLLSSLALAPVVPQNKQDV